MNHAEKPTLMLSLVFIFKYSYFINIMQKN